MGWGYVGKKLQDWGGMSKSFQDWMVTVLGWVTFVGGSVPHSMSCKHKMVNQTKGFLYFQGDQKETSTRLTCFDRRI